MRVYRLENDNGWGPMFGAQHYAVEKVLNNYVDFKLMSYPDSMRYVRVREAQFSFSDTKYAFSDVETLYAIFHDPALCVLHEHGFKITEYEVQDEAAVVFGHEQQVIFDPARATLVCRHEDLEL